MSKSPRALVLLALILTGSGCSELDRYRECRTLADTVNPLLVEIERRAEQSQPTPKGYSELAESYRKLKATVRKLPIKDEQLHDTVAAYQTMVTAAEKQLRLSSTTMGMNKEQLDDAELLRRHQLGMSAALAQQATVQGRLRGLCKP